jgi:6-phosphogluconolactonase
MHDPQHLARHPTLPVIYAAEASNPGAVVSLLINEDGTLSLTSRVSSLGDRAVAVSVHPSGLRAYAANWIGGTVTALPVAADGTLGAPEPIPQGEINGQAAPIVDETTHPHHIRPTPSGRAVVIAYAGSDEVVAHDADAEGRVASLPVTRVLFPEESAPRHVEFHPSGARVYVVGERDSRLHVLEAEAGKPLRLIRSLPTTPPAFTGRNRTSELKLHPDGSHLYVGNRGADCVAIFGLDGSGDVVEILGHCPAMGKGPRGITVDPTGHHLFVANAESGNLVVLTIESDRHLQPLGPPVPVPSASCVVVVRRDALGLHP